MMSTDTAALKLPSENRWFLATATIFFTRAMLFSTWLSQIPAARDYLNLSTEQMGWLIMAYPLGSLLGIVFANELTHRFGSKKLTIFGFAIAAIALVSAGYSIQSGNVLLVALFMLIAGLPMSISDFIGNFEGSSVNRLSKRSLMPAIHGSFGVGMVLAAWFSSVLISAKVELATNFDIIAAVVFVPSIWAATVFPVRHDVEQSLAKKLELRRLNRSVWRDRNTMMIATIGFTFIMAEVAANNWLPLALTGSGFSNADAASALSIFWVVMTLVRSFGGFLVDRLGNLWSLLWSLIFNGLGVLVFMFDPVLHMPYVGITLWAAGLALGFPVVITTIGGDAKMAAPRVNMMITVVYISSVTVGPALGSLGQVIGLYASFAIPLAMIILSAFFSRAIRRI